VKSSRSPQLKRDSLGARVTQSLMRSALAASLLVILLFRALAPSVRHLAATCYVAGFRVAGQDTIVGLIIRLQPDSTTVAKIAFTSLRRSSGGRCQVAVEMGPDALWEPLGPDSNRLSIVTNKDLWITSSGVFLSR